MQKENSLFCLVLGLDPNKSLNTQILRIDFILNILNYQSWLINDVVKIKTHITTSSSTSNTSSTSNMDLESVPIVVGVGRYTQQKGTPLHLTLGPLDMMARTARLAAQDATSSFYNGAKLLSTVDAVTVIQSATETRAQLASPTGAGIVISNNWSKSLSRRVGRANLSLDKCFQTFDGGNSAQMAINDMSERIANKEFSSVLISGCEVLSSLLRAMKSKNSKIDLLQEKWCDKTTATKRPIRIGPQYHVTRVEAMHGLMVPVRTYPMLEQALRASLGLSVEEHMLQQSRMFSGMSQVAAEDPEHAWFPTFRTPEEMANPTSAGNRWVGYPYTKYHCAVMNVDQSASCLLMSVAEAKRRQIPSSKWVYLHGCADTIEKEILKRPNLHRSPAMELMGRELSKAARVNIAKDVVHRDIYSCFPVAVSIVARELGFSATNGKELTLTGGLPFHGGPGSNYALHGLVALTHKLRAEPGSFGLITANGGFLSKHAAGIYSTTPYQNKHPHAIRWTRVKPTIYQSELDSGPELKIAETPNGLGTIETYTVIHTSDGSEKRGMIIGRLDATDERFVAISGDVKLLREMKQRDFLNVRVDVSTNEDGLTSFIKRNGMGSL